ncbi:MAG: CNNM domain-containing protein [Verrucomicrobiota bacterium]
MNAVAFEIAVIVLLLIANGVFAMAEIAVVSANKSRLRHLAGQGNAKARLALELAESPNRFLSTVQIGITLVGVFTGAFGGATLAEESALLLGRIRLAQYADELAFGIVVAVITYCSLVLGELVPKRFGLSNPEGIAMRAARPMNRLSWPCVGLLVSFLSAFDGESCYAWLDLPERAAIVSEDEVR